MPLVHTDLFPTLLALASTAGPGSPEATTAAFEGVDQSRGWLGDCWAQRPATLFECGGARHRIGGWAVIERQWKLIIEVDDDGREGPRRLYDLAVDPGEQRDRSNEAGEASAMLLQLEQTLRAELTRAGWVSLADPPSAER
jgi:arylsulfatase A-like enzyme